MTLQEHFINFLRAFKASGWLVQINITALFTNFQLYNERLKCCNCLYCVLHQILRKKNHLKKYVRESGNCASYLKQYASLIFTFFVILTYLFNHLCIHLFFIYLSIYLFISLMIHSSAVQFLLHPFLFNLWIPPHVFYYFLLWIWICFLAKANHLQALKQGS